MDVSEKNFEWTIECALLADGPDACEGGPPALREDVAGFGEFPPGGYRKCSPERYDRGLGLVPDDVFDFIYATQPKEWQKFKHQLGGAPDRLLRRLASEIQSRGTLEVLRKGIKSDGCTFRLTSFRPSSRLNEELQQLHRANTFSIVRQLRYSERTGRSLDLAIFLNGLPIFTAELKNPLTGQTVTDAIRQYQLDRDPREPSPGADRHELQVLQADHR